MTAEAAQGATYWPGDEQLALLPPAAPVLTELTAVDADAAHGEVYTRRWVVELILDLVDYSETEDLAARRAVEPACGTGAFLGPLVKRLSASGRRHNRAITDAAYALQAFDLLPRNVPGRNADTRNELGDAIKMTSGRDVLPPSNVLRPARELSSSGLVTARPVRQESRLNVTFLLRRHPHLPLLVQLDRHQTATACPAHTRAPTTRSAGRLIGRGMGP
jgi:hypothetical protein